MLDLQSRDSIYSISGPSLPSKNSTRDGLISFTVSLKLLELSSHESRLANRTKLFIELMLSVNHQDTFIVCSCVQLSYHFASLFAILQPNQSKRISSTPRTIKWLAFAGSSILVQDENNTLCYSPSLSRSIFLCIVCGRCPSRYGRRFESGCCLPQDHRRSP